MVSINEVDKTIMELEQRDTTFAVCERLAWLYIVRDHLAESGKEPIQRSTELFADLDGNDFLAAVSDKPVDGVLGILSEHMNCIRAIYPKEYDMLIRKINEL